MDSARDAAGDVPNENDAIPLFKLRRRLGIRRQRLFKWWRFGVIDPRDLGKPAGVVKRRVYLKTFMSAQGRSTTWAYYLEFQRARDVMQADFGEEENGSGEDEE